MTSIAKLTSTELGSICDANDVQAVERLLSQLQTVPNRETHLRRLNDTQGGFSPAHWAVFNDNEAMVRLLHKYNLNMNIPTRQVITHPKFGVIPRGTTPLHAAAIAGSVECVMALLDVPYVQINQPNSLYQSPIFVACVYKNHKTLQLMMAHPGHKPDTQTGLEKQTDPGPESQYYWPKGTTPVMVAAALSHECLAVLLAEFADPHTRDDNGYTPMHYAAQYGNAHALQMLAEHGADVDARSTKQTMCAKSSTPIHVAVRHLPSAGPPRAKSLHTLATLLASKANVNAVDSRGWSVLHACCMQRETAALRLITDFCNKTNTKLNLTTQSIQTVNVQLGSTSMDIPAGITPVQLAFLRKAYDCAEVLLRQSFLEAKNAGSSNSTTTGGPPAPSSTTAPKHPPDPLEAFITQKIMQEAALTERLTRVETSLGLILSTSADGRLDTSSNPASPMLASYRSNDNLAGASVPMGSAPSAVATVPVFDLNASQASTSDLAAKLAQQQQQHQGNGDQHVSFPITTTSSVYDPHEQYQLYLDDRLKGLGPGLTVNTDLPPDTLYAFPGTPVGGSPALGARPSHARVPSLSLSRSNSGGSGLSMALHNSHYRDPGSHGVASSRSREVKADDDDAPLVLSQTPSGRVRKSQLPSNFGNPPQLSTTFTPRGLASGPLDGDNQGMVGSLDASFTPSFTPLVLQGVPFPNAVTNPSVTGDIAGSVRSTAISARSPGTETERFGQAVLGPDNNDLDEVLSVGAGSVAGTAVASNAALGTANSTDVADLQKQVRSLQKKLADAKSKAKESARAGNSEMEKQLDALRRELASTKEAVAMKEARIESLEKEKARVQSELESKIQMLTASLASSAKEAQSESERADQRIANRDARIAYLENQFREMEAANAELNRKLSAQTFELQMATEKLRVLEQSQQLSHQAGEAPEDPLLGGATRSDSDAKPMTKRRSPTIVGAVSGPADVSTNYGLQHKPTQQSTESGCCCTIA